MEKRTERVSTFFLIKKVLQCNSCRTNQSTRLIHTTSIRKPASTMRNELALKAKKKTVEFRERDLNTRFTSSMLGV